MGLDASAFQRMLLKLLPPGRLRTQVDGLLRLLALGSADEIERATSRSAKLLHESYPKNADELLAEYEEDLDLEPVGSEAQRVARVAALMVARQRYRPSDFQVALAPLLQQEIEDVVVIERTSADALAMGDEREIFRFFVYRDPALDGTADIDGAQALIDTIKPSHTQGHVIESIDFLCDDPYSLCDRDLLGA